MESGNVSLLARQKYTDLGPSGYDVGKATVYNVRNIPMTPADLSSLSCSKCSLILRDPCQVITCGHRYCRMCIDQLISGGEGPYTCIVDNEKFKKQEIRSDKGCLRDLKTIQVDCPSDPSCGWKGKLFDLDKHKEVCTNKLIECSQGCGGTFLATDLESHMSSECPSRPSTCEHCKKTIPFDTVEEHNGICDEYPVSCKNCKKKLNARKELNEHLEQDCQACDMHCSDCGFKGQKSELTQHIVDNHLIKVFFKMAKSEKKMVLVEEENRVLRQELSEFRGVISDLQSEMRALKAENQAINVKFESMKSIIEKQERESHGVVKDCREFGDLVERDGPGKVAVDVHKDNVTQLPTKFKLEDNPPPDYLAPLMDQSLYGVQLRGQNMKPLNGMIAEPINSLTEMEVSRPGAAVGRIKQNVEMLQSTVQRLSELVQATQENQTRSGIAIDDIRLRQDVLDVKTTNGVLIWKIPDLRRRYRDALDRRTISLYSPPFYTSPHGYRMCIRTYLNGDGIGKGTHVSLFFVLMRSEHDNLLSWPFKQSVRFTLINQKNPGASISEAFIPDLKSPSFHKPENDMNIASGFPKFARQSVLNDDNFVQGNTIFIKCQVDLAGITSQ